MGMLFMDDDYGWPYKPLTGRELYEHKMKTKRLIESLRAKRNSRIIKAASIEYAGIKEGETAIGFRIRTSNG